MNSDFREASMKIIQSKDLIFHDQICPHEGLNGCYTCRPASISHTHAAKCMTVMWLHLAHSITGLLRVQSTHKYILHPQSVSRLVEYYTSRRNWKTWWEMQHSFVFSCFSLHFPGCKWSHLNHLILNMIKYSNMALYINGTCITSF